MYKVQLDKNNYFTGNCCIIGDIENSVNTEKLPNDERKYYPAYKGIKATKEIEEEYIEVIDDEAITKTRIVTIDVYKWELDESKKAEIDGYVEPPKPKTEVELLQEQVDMLTECLLEVSELLYE